LRAETNERRDLDSGSRQSNKSTGGTYQKVHNTRSVSLCHLSVGGNGHIAPSKTLTLPGRLERLEQSLGIENPMDQSKMLDKRVALPESYCPFSNEALSVRKRIEAIEKFLID
jgi:hypothetical protein